MAGLTLKQFRRKYKLTQKMLADRIGTSITTISKYENGEWIMNQYVIDRIREEYDEEIRPVCSKKPRKVWVKVESPG